MSLTIAASTTGSCPACSMPATDTDIRRIAWSCATSRPMPSARARTIAEPMRSAIHPISTRPVMPASSIADAV